ncbi:MAG: tRNA1(Val) (adenine(37)-N6)-methyltransferase [Bacteroidota bacterium]
MEEGFQFKQFYVSHLQSTMKVGTDATLLGAWAEPRDATQILDIGTGCGVIALMLAQKSAAQICGIDIDVDSTLEAAANFAASPWRNRLTAKYASLQKYVSENGRLKYDLIISNPPFFTSSLKNQSQPKALARHNDSLPFDELISLSKEILLPQGRFYLIIPATEEKNIIRLATKNDLSIAKICRISAKTNRKPNRIMFCLVNGDQQFEESSLVIRKFSNKHSAEYNDLLKDYLLNI